MTSAKDYDAPRRSTIEDTETDSLDALKTARADPRSADVDLDENDTADSLELPGADLSGEELTMLVIPETGRRVHLHLLLPGPAPQPHRLAPRPAAGLHRLRLRFWRRPASTGGTCSTRPGR